MWFFLILLTLSNGQMTNYFPLGSCKMDGPSLPYVLTVASMEQERICFNIELSPNYEQECADRKLSIPCDNMISNNNKIVFWYRQVPECGFNLTQSKKHLQVFPWDVKFGSKTQRAAKYQMFAYNASKPHAIGDIALFKWEFKNTSNIEVDVTRSRPFKRPSDINMHMYKLCFTFSYKVLNFIYCITNKFQIKYSFYDPHKSICTVGNLNIQ